MGNSESSVEESSSSSFTQRLSKDFVFVREKKDPRFGDIQLYKEKGQDRYIFLKAHWCGDEENYNQFLRNCSKRIKINHPNVLKMIGFNQHSETQICGDFSKINCYYEYFSLNLEKELDKRLPEQKFFSEPEICACQFFESNKIYHGDLRPINILLTVQGIVKIADNGIVNQSKNGYIKALFDGECPYLSPLLMNALANKEKRPSHNQFKSDVFSLGMTLLECCMLYKSLSFYDYSTMQIRHDLVEDFINRARLMYSGFLVNLIREMLNKEEFQRPTFHEIAAILAPYKQSIQSLTPFSADYVTVKQNFVHPDQQLILQSGVVTQPAAYYQLGNGQGLNLLNHSISCVQSSLAQSKVNYSPDKNLLAHSKLVFQQNQSQHNGTPTNFTQSIVTPSNNLHQQQQQNTPGIFTPNQSTLQMAAPVQQVQQQQQLQQQQQIQLLQNNNLAYQGIVPLQNQQTLANPNNGFIQSQGVNQLQQQQQQQQAFGGFVIQPQQGAQFVQNGQGQLYYQQIQPQLGVAQQQGNIQQIPLNSLQQQQSLVNGQVNPNENTPSNNQPLNTQPNSSYTPSHANNTQLAYSPINMIYQNPPQISEKPFSAVNTINNNSNVSNNLSQQIPQQQQSYQQVQPFQLQSNLLQQSQGIPSSENLQNNSSATSAQFIQLGQQQPQQQQQLSSQQQLQQQQPQQEQLQQQQNNQTNGQTVQDSIQYAINYSNQVLQRNPNF